jgi:homoserine/homoserine lactone efflux protein
VSLQVWLAYLAVSLPLCLSPGPAVLFTIGQALWRGPQAGIRAVAGIEVANIAYFILSAVGLVALLALSRTAFDILKLVGAAYLIWLGVRAFWGSFKPGELSPKMSARPFLDGLIIQIANPKAVLFFVAILPQFVDKAHPVPRQIGVLSATGITLEAIVLTGYSLAAGLLRRSADLSRVRVGLDRIGGVMLICVGLATALYRRG